MGRPLNKKYMGNPAQTGIQVTATVFVDADKEAEAGWILRQRSNTRYVAYGTESEKTLICKLVNGAPAALGEMSVAVDAGNGNLILNQTHTNFNDVGNNGDFTGGTDHAKDDVITLSNGATVEVTSDDEGVVDGFKILTFGEIVQPGATLTQVSSSGEGVGFSITLGDNNFASVVEYARIINNRTVKTFQGSIYPWPGVAVIQNLEA